MAIWCGILRLPLIFGVLITLVQQVVTQGTVVFNAETTTTGDSYYIGQPLTVTCKRIGLPASGSVTFGVSFVDDGSVFAGCFRSFQNSDQWTPSNLPPGDSFPDGIMHQPDCDVLANDDTATIVLNITQELATYNMKCVDNAGIISDASLSIETVKEPPQNLEMSFSPEQIIENQTLTVTCASSFSASSYKYELIKDGATTEIPSGEYTPTAEDRNNGFKVKCSDTANEEWRVIFVRDVEVTTEVFPRYITRDWDQSESRPIKLNPANPQPLSCDIEGRPTPTYTWTSNRTDLSGVTGNTLSFEMNSRENKDIEETTCTASVDGVTLQQPVLITWIITWDDEAPTNPPPSPGTTEGKNASPVGAAVGGAVGGVIVLIIIIAIIGFCCWKKRQASQESGKKGADLPLNENGDTRPSRPTKGRAPTNDKKPLNDEIIYSEVHAINQPHPYTAMVRPTQTADRPPEVEYTSIDFLKTDKQKGNPAPNPGRQPVGMEYESRSRSM